MPGWCRGTLETSIRKVSSPTLSIAGRSVGESHPAYVIAEMSANHNGSFDKAVELVRAAARAGADAIKLQTYTADTMTLKSSDPIFRIDSGTLWDGTTLYELYARASTPWDWQPKLFALAGELGLHCFSSPFDATAVDFLEQMGVPAYKIASFEIVDLPLIERVSKTGKPIIMSTGMATLPEIDEAVSAARSAGANQIALLACSSAYPSRPESARLSRVRHLSETFGVVTGFSDHTLGIPVAIAAAAVGAAIIEKHLCLSRADPGADSAFSLEPDEFKAMVDGIRAAQAAIGEPVYGPSESERSSLGFRRSLFVVRDVKQGERFTAENVRAIRPAGGLHTRHLKEILQSRAAADVRSGTPLSWEHVSRVAKP